jgi:hypothetical protein
MDTSKFATINQTDRHPLRTTEQYRFIPTSEVLDNFAERGWFPASIREAGVRNPENYGFQKHLIRLQSPDFDRKTLNVGDAFPEIVLKNSHSGETSLQLYAGILEKVCSNGLIIETGRAEDIRIQHLGYTAWMVDAAISRLAEVLATAFRQRERWRKLILPLDARVAFADAAIIRRFESKFSVEPEEVLRPRRLQQADFSLWSVFNTIQESIIRGGVRQVRADGSSVRSRPVKSVDEEVRINRELWRLAEELEKAVQ